MNYVYCINYVYCVHCICFGCHYGLNIQSELHSELALGLHTHTIWMKQQYWKFWILLQKCSAMHLNHVESRPWSYSKHSEYYRIQRPKKTLAGCCYSQLWILMCNMCRSYCNLSSINTLFWTVGLNVHMAWIHTKSLSSFSNSITPMFMVREHLQDHDSDHEHFNLKKEKRNEIEMQLCSPFHWLKKKRKYHGHKECCSS